MTMCVHVRSLFRAAIVVSDAETGSARSVAPCLTSGISLCRYDTYMEELSVVVSGAASHNARVAAKKAAKEAAREHHEG